jgi:hypothetical protein
MVQSVERRHLHQHDRSKDLFLNRASSVRMQTSLGTESRNSLPHTLRCGLETSETCMKNTAAILCLETTVSETIIIQIMKKTYKLTVTDLAVQMEDDAMSETLHGRH